MSQSESMYSVLDIRAGLWSRPFTVLNDAVARRLFEQMAVDKSSLIAQFSMDFELYRLGSFVMDKGRVVAEEEPVFVCRAADFKGNVALKEVARG